MTGPCRTAKRRCTPEGAPLAALGCMHHAGKHPSSDTVRWCRTADRALPDLCNQASGSILMAVAGELAVTRERLDTLERVLDENGLLARDAIDRYEPNADAAQERGLWHQDFIARILRVVQQEIEQFDEDSQARRQARVENVSATTELEDLIEELANT